jgi:demethylmenaquinone methyltransferase/2-methoxy-6-polyprenyl-1,4-benzoquinol methylase
MIKDTISTAEARRYYDRLGAGHDWAEYFEGRAKTGGLILLELAPAQSVLNVGVGSGKEHAQLQAAVAPGGLAVGLDLSRVMLNLTQARTGAPLCEADARQLPFLTASFDRLLAAYVLDLIPARDLTGLLIEFRRVLKPDGRLVLVSLTEGVTWPSRGLVALWKMIYRVSPVVCGGCRPVQLAGQLYEAGFSQVERAVVVQLGVPSEVIAATS